MDCRPGMFPTGRAAAIYFLRVIMLMIGSLVIAGMMTWCLWQIFKVVH